MSQAPFPQIFLRLSHRWGADQPNHRVALRERLAREYQNLLITPPLDLEQRPRLRDGYVSISHTTDLGGYVRCTVPVGFDIERSDRVSPKIIARVSTMEEFAAAPSPALLWAAKEAAYKALAGFDQPATISSIIIQWQSESRTERDGFFTILAPESFGVRSLTGRVVTRNHHVLAIAWISGEILSLHSA